MSNVYLGHVGSLCFPREFGIKINDGKDFSRLIVRNKDEYLTRIREYNSRTDCFVSVYHFRDKTALFKEKRDYSSAVINKVFIDIDDENDLWNAYLETKQLVEKLLTLNCVPRVYFSGNKGFHVFIDFPVIGLEDSDTLRKFIDSLEQELELKKIDAHCKGDLARVSRIPNTQHMKSKLYCIPIAVNEFFSFTTEHAIREMAKQPRTDFSFKIEPCEKIAELLNSIEQEINAEKIRAIHKKIALQMKGKYVKKSYNSDLRPCMNFLIDKAQHSKLSHGERFSLTLECIAAKWTDDAIVSIFEKQEDFDEKITRYQVEHAREREYKPFRCERIKYELKICLESCPRSKYIQTLEGKR